MAELCLVSQRGGLFGFLVAIISAREHSILLTFDTMINAGPGNMAETQKRTDWEPSSGGQHANHFLFYENDPGLLRLCFDGK